MINPVGRKSSMATFVLARRSSGPSSHTRILVSHKIIVLRAYPFRPQSACPRCSDAASTRQFLKLPQVPSTHLLALAFPMYQHLQLVQRRYQEDQSSPLVPRQTGPASDSGIGHLTLGSGIMVQWMSLMKKEGYQESQKIFRLRRCRGIQV